MGIGDRYNVDVKIFLVEKFKEWYYGMVERLFILLLKIIKYWEKNY